jgi:hypothetical protein
MAYDMRYKGGGGKNVAIAQKKKKKKKGPKGQVEYDVHLRKKEVEKGTAITNNNKDDESKLSMTVGNN